ncbi:hypothetical protein RI129_007663 [Pyrocoelia pectoralis]|uniref:Cytochrome P450 n=1 Tax=Pyrocoelia pectoralis TaxID=417401 RepID=A0AAN7VEI7_9COLE
MWILVGLLCGIITLSWYLLFIKKFSYWKERGVLHPPISKLFGNLKQTVFFQKSEGELYHEMYRKYSQFPYVGFYRIRKPAILLRDPELIKDVLTSNFSSFSDNGIDIDGSNGPIMANNTFFTNGTEWKKNRSQVTPSFTTKQMKLYFPLMQIVAKRLVRYLEDSRISSGGIEAQELCEKYTMDVVGTCVLGLDAKSFDSSTTDYIRFAKQIFSTDLVTTINFMLLSIAPRIAHLLKIPIIPKSSANYYKTIIDEAIKYRNDNNVIRDDFLKTMIDLQEKLGSDNFTSDKLSGHIFSFLIDGFITTSLVLAFVLYEIAANIDFQEKLRSEIENKMGEGEKSIMDYESLHDLTFFNSLINETLRLHPIITFLTKRCTKEYVLPPMITNGKSVVLQPGIPVIIPTFSLHYDSANFSNPTKFDPHRFDGKDDKIKKGSYVPFGEGPRMCIGQKFALAQIKAAVIHIILNYDIRVNDKTKTPLEYNWQELFLSAKGGLWLDFIKRH